MKDITFSYVEINVSPENASKRLEFISYICIYSCMSVYVYILVYMYACMCMHVCVGMKRQNDLF